MIGNDLISWRRSFSTSPKRRSIISHPPVPNLAGLSPQHSPMPARTTESVASEQSTSSGFE